MVRPFGRHHVTSGFVHRRADRIPGRPAGWRRIADAGQDRVLASLPQQYAGSQRGRARVAGSGYRNPHDLPVKWRRAILK